MQAPPPRGSLQEWVLILVLDRLETIEHARFRALAQIMLTVGVDSADAKNEGVKAFDDYMKTAFPGLESKKKKREDVTKQLLKEWIGQGPLKVTPSAQMHRIKSKMVRRVAEVDSGRASALYRKLGDAKDGSR